MRPKRLRVVVNLAVIAIMSLFCVRSVAEALASGSAKANTVVTDTPPLVDVPVWSMATINDDADQTTNMNLLTYATPVSIRPTRLYALGLFKATKSRDNFLREKSCILQLLSGSNQKHIECVRLLGGTSGKEVSKEEVLDSVHGIELETLASDNENETNEDLPKVLPGCVQYLKLSMVGDEVIDYDGWESSHDVVICKVDKMWTSVSEEFEGGANEDHYLSTGHLRELGLITEQGRIAPLQED